MITTFIPSQLSGTITPPECKSLVHRYIICSALADKPCKLNLSNFSDDITATLEAVENFGAVVNRENGFIEICPNERQKCELKRVRVRESASTLRFLLPVFGALGMNAEFETAENLAHRPLQELIFALKENGAEITENPLTIKGKLKNGVYKLDGRVSSQFVSGLLFALPLLRGDSEIIFGNETVSKSYVGLTIDVLKEYGIKIERTKSGFFVLGRQKYHSPERVFIERDFGLALPFIVGALFSGEVVINGINADSKQADYQAFSLLKSAGGNLFFDKGKLTVKQSNLTAIEFSCENCPDVTPLMAVALARADGISKIYGVDRLKYKESDRIDGIQRLLKFLGVKTEYRNDTLSVFGNKSSIFKIVEGKLSFPDHRMIMAVSAAALCADREYAVENTESISKSYPEFFKDYKTLGGKTDVI